MSKLKFLPILAGAAALSIVGVTALPAHADIVLIGGTPALSFRDLGAQGFGNAPPMLTLQLSPFESGSFTAVNVPHGDADTNVPLKGSTPTLSALGWNSGANVGIGFNGNQSNDPITMQTLVLTIFDATAAHNPVPGGTFSLPSPVQFSQADLALEPGHGSAVFDFGLTANEQTAFNAIVAMTGSSGFFAGLSSSLGCAGTPSATCQVSNDGAETYIGFSQAIIPSPLIGHGLLALLAIGGVLFGGKLLETLKKHHPQAA
jgi:hypothetical protein